LYEVILAVLFARLTTTTKNVPREEAEKIDSVHAHDKPKIALLHLHLLAIIEVVGK